MNQTLTYNQSEIRFGKLTDTDFDTVLNSERYRNAKKVIITDENVFDLWIEYFISSFEGLKEAEIIQLPAGEENKVLSICEHVWGALSEYEISRNDLIINVGGGVITDTGGFIASTFKRGLSFINVPTTLLAQVDASVGGKTGIDLGPFKNQIGLFADADYVFIDSSFLSTLPKVELISGYAEMLKHGLIADQKYWVQLNDIDPLYQPTALLEFIYTSVVIKRNIVIEDHLEDGLRKNLNFGHTIGHAIEGYCLQQENPIPHGYGVAWGMLAESFLSKEKGFITTGEFEEIELKLTKSYPKLEVSIDTIPTLRELLKNDKKNSNGTINFTLLSEIGNAVYNQEVSDKQLDKALQFILNP